jgi:DNA-binding IclR family transcriptional regulator
MVLREVLIQERPTVPKIALALGWAKSDVHGHLVNLRDLGLVRWEDGKVGTLRPAVRVVPFGEAAR